MRSIPVSARLPVLVLALLVMMALPDLAYAQGVVNHLYDKFQFGASAADVVLSSTFRIDNADGTAGTEIDFGDLGISTSAFAPAGAVSWRPGRRHELQLSYVYIKRTGGRVLTEDINFGDTTFTAGLRTDTRFSAPNLALMWRFAFMAKEKTQIGFQVGLGALFFNIGIDALASVSAGANSDSVQYSAEKSLTGPTASLGLFAAFRAGDHWYFGVNGGAIGAKVSGITATTWLGAADARYFFSDHWAAAAGWAINGIKISSDPNNDGSFIDLGGSIKYSFQVFRLGIIYALH